MKRINILFLVLSVFVFYVNSQVFTPTETLVSPWVTQTGFLNNMPVKAQVNKDNVLFIPEGLVLGIFKNGICYGQSSYGLSTGPGGIKYNNITMGCDKETESGFEYKVYDPNSKNIYSVAESLTFKANTALGSVAALIQLHISGIAGLKETDEAFFNIYPNPIKSKFSVKIGLESSNNTLIELYDMKGSLLNIFFNGLTTTNQIISCSLDKNIAKGIYFIKVSVGSKVCIRKVSLD